MESEPTTEQELIALRQRVAELESHDNQRDGRARLIALFEDMFEGIQVISYNYEYLYLNKSALEQGRFSGEEKVIGKRMSDVYPGIDQTEMYDCLRTCMSERTPLKLTNHFSFPDGSRGWFDLRFTPIPVGALVLSVDVTEQKEAEEQARLREEDLVATLECMTEGIITTDLQGRVTRINRGAEELTGWSRDEALGVVLDEMIQLVDHKSMQLLDQPVGRLIREEMRVGLTDGIRLLRRDGSMVPIACGSAHLKDASGAVRGIVIAIEDLNEEFKLNAMLQQAQKMEAIGSLAGGIAHDFNNYLMVISGYCQMVAEKAPNDEDLRDDLEQIRDAASKAAALTGQLLAFSRQKILRPEVINLNAVVRQTEKMLSQLIGEDINLVTKLYPQLDPVEFDPSQIEQIVLNLAVNARDAMPRGGRLTIETRNEYLDEEYARLHADAHEGHHVMIAISDNGMGMEPEIRNRIFDPFFTTKPPGKGTGLGLSTVYGIVKQSGGNIWVYSEVGNGTSFKIYLPRSERHEKAASIKPERTTDTGTETIVVVEDDRALRKLLARILESNGYQVMACSAPAEAISVCRNYPDTIHMMLTDVIMPEMDGAELSTLVKEIRPDIKVVFMSGYTDDAIVHRGVLEPGVAFIEKPVSREVLLAKIREFL